MKNRYTKLGVVVGTALLSTVLRAADAEPLALTQMHQWARSYLFNSLLLAEYDLLSSDPQAHEEAELIRPAWEKARWAWDSARYARQGIPNSARLRAKLMKHGQMLRAAKAPAMGLREFLRPAVHPNLELTRPELPSALQFDLRFAESWSFFRKNYVTDKAWDCGSSGYRDVTDIEELQSRGGEIRARVAAWDLNRVHCATAAVAGLVATGSLSVTTALGFVALVGDRTDPDLHTSILIAGESWSGVLQKLMEQMERGQPYRLAYEIAQRIYSQRHKGQGRVALDGP